MARSTLNVKTTADRDECLAAIREYLTEKHFHETKYKGDMVWKRGNGTIFAAQYLKVEFYLDTLLLTGWLKDCIRTRESNLKGIPSPPQQMLLRVIRHIEDMVKELETKQLPEAD